MKNLITRISGKVSKKASAVCLAVFMLAFTALPAFAANVDLDDATADLTTGITDMKTNALVIIAACILVIVVVFGIGWLINIVKRNMSKA
jgi:hypothetical protein